MTKDGSTHKDNPFARRRSKPLDIGKRPSRPKNRQRAEIEEGLQDFESEKGVGLWIRLPDDQTDCSLT